MNPVEQTMPFTVAPAMLVVRFEGADQDGRATFELLVCDAAGQEMYGFGPQLLVAGDEFRLEVERIDARFRVS